MSTANRPPGWPQPPNPGKQPSIPSAQLPSSPGPIAPLPPQSHGLRIRPLWLALSLVAVLLIVGGGTAYGLIAGKAPSSTIPYQTDGPAHLVEALGHCNPPGQGATPNCTAYFALDDGPTLSTLNGDDFSPPITDIVTTFSLEDTFTVVYRADHTTHIETDVLDSHINGDFYSVVQLTLFDQSGRQTAIYTTAEYPPKPLQPIATGGLILLIVGLALALIAVCLLIGSAIQRKKQQAALVSSSALSGVTSATTINPPDIPLPPAEPPPGSF